MTTPSPGSGQPAQTTEYGYDEMERQNRIVHPDAAETHFTYWPNGQLRKTWGSRTYPVEYTYDPQGRKRTMTTWQDHSGETGAAVTTWNYHPQRGWLENKRYNDNTGPDYTYTAAGCLKTRTWARQISGQDLVTTYAYNEAGDLWTIAYSDDTPEVTHTYDRLGMLETTEDAAGTLTRGYTAAGALEYEDYTGGLLDGVSVDRGYDAMHRLRHLATDADYGVTYLFDPTGRLSQVGESHHRADFGYELNTEILDSVEIRRVGIERLRHERSTDKLGRIEWTKTTVDGQTSVRRDYTYNSANQRTIIEHEDGRAWHYGYDSLGQVTAAHKRLSTDPQSAILPGYSFGYAFDGIGNRETATRSDRTATYRPNLLNQYDQRTVPGFIDVLGEAYATATVTVDGQPTQRTNRYFRREITVANSASAAYSAVEVEAEFDSQTVDETRHAFLPEDPEVFVYDADGNLISDGRWTYEWDSENRLKAIERLPAVAALSPDLNQRLEFAYDFQGRRIQKTVKEWDIASSAWQTAKDLRFIYDGWNLIEERDALDSDTVLRKHVWGPDLSGTMQGAGGVGGLLWTQTPTQTFAASSDANGNVVAWVNTATLAVAGKADYSPFGEVIVQTGVAKEMPFGFSTKYEDAETGLLYYGYRYVHSSTGRFLSKDPIEERGGLNLYSFVENNPVGKVDVFGLYSLNFVYMFAPPANYRGGGGFTWSQGNKNAVVSAHLRARQLAPGLLKLVSEYLEKISETYCPTKGRDILKHQVEYTEITISEALDAMYSGKTLDVGPVVWSGLPEDDRGAEMITWPFSSSKLWVLDLFFTLGLNERAGVFFHEVTHLIDRTPGDDYFKEGGHHKIGATYGDLIVRNTPQGVRAVFQRNINHINGGILMGGSQKDLVVRKDGSNH